MYLGTRIICACYKAQLLSKVSRESILEFRLLPPGFTHDDSTGKFGTLLLYLCIMCVCKAAFLCGKACNFWQFSQLLNYTVDIKGLRQFVLSEGGGKDSHPYTPFFENHFFLSRYFCPPYQKLHWVEKEKKGSQEECSVFHLLGLFFLKCTCLMKNIS